MPTLPSAYISENVQAKQKEENEQHISAIMIHHFCGNVCVF